MWDIPLQVPHDYGRQRLGRPRLNWVLCIVGDAWTAACSLAQRPDLGSFDRDRDNHTAMLRGLGES
eukprot:12891300-Prorocentrum_lima.AAC.1